MNPFDERIRKTRQHQLRYRFPSYKVIALHAEWAASQQTHSSLRLRNYVRVYKLVYTCLCRNIAHVSLFFSVRALNPRISRTLLSYYIQSGQNNNETKEKTEWKLRRGSITSCTEGHESPARVITRSRPLVPRCRKSRNEATVFYLIYE